MDISSWMLRECISLWVKCTPSGQRMLVCNTGSCDAINFVHNNFKVHTNKARNYHIINQKEALHFLYLLISYRRRAYTADNEVELWARKDLERKGRERLIYRLGNQSTATLVMTTLVKDRYTEWLESRALVDDLEHDQRRPKARN